MDRWTKLEVYSLDLEAPDGLENSLRHAQKSLREGRGVVVLRTRAPLPSHDLVVRLSQRELPPALPGARARESVSGGDCAHHRDAGSGDLGGHHAEAAGGLLLFRLSHHTGGLRTKPVVGNARNVRGSRAVVFFPQWCCDTGRLARGGGGGRGVDRENQMTLIVLLGPRPFFFREKSRLRPRSLLP